MGGATLRRATQLRATRQFSRAGSRVGAFPAVKAVMAVKFLFPFPRALGFLIEMVKNVIREKK
jgi:hypothetical protein